MIYTDGLETERLVTRFVTPEDAAVWADYCSDPIATRFTKVPDKTPEEMAKLVIEMTRKRYEDGRYGLQVLINKETGEFVGQCGLMVQEVNGESVVEIGYHLLPKHWGKGYASEAAQGFRDYGFENNFADSIVSIIDPQNELSKRVAERNGMRLVDANADFRGQSHHLYRITREEWEELKSKVKSYPDSNRD
jgi:[ribosomal protein S5]-alanine N-acetyltransferase